MIPRLGRDLHNELPKEKGFSERNIKRMLAFYREYPHLDFVPQAVAQADESPKVPQAVALFPTELVQALPWGHHAELMSKVKEPVLRQWYMQAAVKNGWSRNILVMQIESYCSVVDDQLRHENDQPTIGLILCQQPNRVLAEYTLRGMKQPIGVSSYELTRSLPSDLQSSLPTIEQIERELTGDERDDNDRS